MWPAETGLGSMRSIPVPSTHHTRSSRHYRAGTAFFARITVLLAVNGDKQPATTQSERAIQLRQELPANWDNVSVTAWAGLTVEFCRQHGADVIIRGVRNRSNLSHEYRLAAMNEAMGITTLLLPANPGLAAVSSTVLRGLSIRRRN